MTIEFTRPGNVAVACLLASAWLLVAATDSRAGCGCDHPPPDWAMVMPSFGSHGKVLSLHPDGFNFETKEDYDVVFRDHTGASRTVVGYAEAKGLMHVRVPAGLTPGPVEITIKEANGDKSYTYPSSLFTVMSPAPMIPNAEGVYQAADFGAAVTEDGTLLVSFNLSDVLNATQFAFQFTDLALTYGQDDVVFYNADGVDLTLFTLSVADEVEHQWGSYYGWIVEDDTDLQARIYENKVLEAGSWTGMSDVLTYWRHEFWTYFKAHQPGGSHAVTNGMHPDGTLHIDHDHLVLAITGGLRDANDPANPDKVVPLEPGQLVFDLALALKLAADPVEPGAMIEMLHTVKPQPLVPESPTVYDVYKLDGSLLGGDVTSDTTSEPSLTTLDTTAPATY